ncbi:hypothetical protein JCM10213_000965 [Rhodosporidiobolus nylandii]
MSTPTPVLEPSAPDDTEPAHSGYSPSPTSRLASPLNDAPAPLDAPPASHGPELNPHALRQRLLQTLSPAAVAEHGPRLASSSAPDLARVHGQGAAPSPATAGEKDGVRRTNSYVVASRAESPFSSSATHLPFPHHEGGLGNGHVTPVGHHPSLAQSGGRNSPHRPPLLSKKLLEPKKPVGKNPSFTRCLINTCKYSWLGVLFAFVPVAWAMDLSHQSSTLTFVFSFLAIIPCAAWLGFATEELALRVGDALGGLLNATFGNAVELIISILALTKGELDIVRSSMLGSILSNCLLVLGGCFFAGGIKYHEQGYSTRAAQLHINLLGIAVTALVAPVAFHYFLAQDPSRIPLADDAVLRLSRGVSFILLFVYLCYLVFQLWTHSYLYVPHPARDPRAPLPASTAALLLYTDGPQPPSEGRVFRIPSWGSSSSSSSTRSSLRTTRSRASSVHAAHAEEAGLPPTTTAMGEEPVAFSASDAQTQVLNEGGMNAHDVEKALSGPNVPAGNGHDLDEHEEPKLSVWFALGLLCVTTAVTGVTAEFLVSSIDGLTESTSINREFVALILLPVVGNAAEHVTAITVATKNKLDLSLAVAVGSSIQIALFVIPVLVLLAWVIGQPLDFLFDPYETLLVFLCILSVNLAISDSRTHWMEGLSLMAAYVVIALTAWFYPGTAAP